MDIREKITNHVAQCGMLRQEKDIVLTCSEARELRIRLEDATKLMVYVNQLEHQNKELKEELVESLFGEFYEIAHKIPEGEDKAGWWDSCARGDACYAGDRLVELGLMECHPDGYGRRQFYRPIEKS